MTRSTKNKKKNNEQFLSYNPIKTSTKQQKTCYIIHTIDETIDCVLISYFILHIYPLITFKNFSILYLITKFIIVCLYNFVSSKYFRLRKILINLRIYFDDFLKIVYLVMSIYINANYTKIICKNYFFKLKLAHSFLFLLEIFSETMSLLVFFSIFINYFASIYNILKIEADSFSDYIYLNLFGLLLIFLVFFTNVLLYYLFTNNTIFIIYMLSLFFILLTLLFALIIIKRLKININLFIAIIFEYCFKVLLVLVFNSIIFLEYIILYYEKSISNLYFLNQLEDKRRIFN